MPSTLTDRLYGLTTSVAMKAPCRVVTTANIVLAGLQTLDGVTLEVQNRVLVTGQTAPVENGIWLAQSGAWLRAEDWNGSLDAVTGTRLFVYDGTANNYSDWVCETAGEIVVGTTAVTFSKLSDAANISFTQSGAGADEETVEDALRREVWADQYKLAADADDRSCIERAVTALLAAGGGGVVRLSRRAYTLNAGMTFTGINNVRLVGAGKSGSGTMLRGTFAAGDAITFDGCQGCEVSGVRFWPTVRKTSGYEVTLQGGCFDTLIDIRCDYGWAALNINGATETRYKVNSRYMLGTIGVRFGGTVTHGSYRAICLDQISDNPYPVSATAANAKTWSSGMALTAGDHFVSGGAVWQCTGSGNASTVAPSGYPAGTSPDSVFSTSVSHGTATIRWICNESLSHIVMDSYAYSFVIVSAALLNGVSGLRMLDLANTGTSYPIWIFAGNLETDHSRSTGVELAGGEGFFDGGNCWIGSVLTGNGLLVATTFRGNVSLGSGLRVTGNAQHGILRQAGPTDIRITGAEVTDNSAVSAGTYHGLTIAAGSVDTHVNGGRYGDSISVAGNNQGYGINVGAGCDKTTIIGANLRGNTTGPLLLGASQTNLFIRDCPGYSATSFNVKDYGALGNGVADDRAAIQAAEDAAATLAGITGSETELYFPDGNFAVGATVQKKTGVQWRGTGRIEHLNYATATTTFSLVTANAVNDWSIEGLSFRNVTRTRELAAAIPIVVGIGTLNSCIDIYGCSRFSVRHNTFRQFTFGIVYRGCSDGYINDNWLYADSGKTAEQIDDNTYTHFSTFIAGSGGIVITYEGAGTPSAVSRNVQICGNHVEVAGLDVGIEALNQTYDAQRILVQGNTVRGCTTGIQAYRGSFADPGTAPTYNSGLVIALNRVYLSWGAGVYMRGLVGGQVYGNTFERCGKVGTDGAASSGSMVFRVNPFTGGGTFGAPASPVSNDHALLVFGNRVIDHGREDVACDPAVLIELDGVKFTGNEVQRSDERFNTARGFAIAIGNGKKMRSFECNDNTITGKWTTGIEVTDIARPTGLSTHWGQVNNNKLIGDFTNGINIQWFACNIEVLDNILTGTFTDGIKHRLTPLSTISRNKLRGTLTNGITLASGNLLGDIPHMLSGGTITKNNRRGASLTVEDNDVWGASTPYQITESSGSDAFFWSRCHNFERNRINGQPVVHEFSGGTPALTNAPKVWHKHETTMNSSLAANVPAGKICLTPGQGGSTTTATGTTAVGSPTITAVSSLDGWAPGIYLTMAEFTGVRKIIAIDTAAGSITVDGNATAAVVGATITPATPTFATLALVEQIGYATGAGGTVTQITSRTTGVTLNKASGQITLFSAAGATAYTSFTVTNSFVGVNDTVSVVQKSGTDRYIISVTDISAGSFEITFATTGGTTVEQPVFTFNVVKGAAA